MKTSELIKWCEENNIQFTENYAVIEIKDVGRVLKDSAGIKTFDSTYPKSSIERLICLEKLIEYSKTPLEEREDEKKYYLMFPKEFDNFRYLNLNKQTNKFGRCLIFEIESDSFKTKFTQKEIDGMKFDTKFFDKVEVNE
jgi:hypothetical protein